MRSDVRKLKTGLVLGAGLLMGMGLMTGASAAAQTTRQILNADAQWKFIQDDVEGAEQPGLNDADWRTVDLPHDWSIESAPDAKNATGSGGGFFPAGVGWYRRTFTPPASWKGKQVRVEFDGVASNATVYLNGKQLGVHPYAYTSFGFDLTPGLMLGETNLLAVRVDNSQQPSSRWYMGAGIDRHVRVVVTEPLHVAPWGVFVSTPEATAASAKVAVRVKVENAGPDAGLVTVKTTVYRWNDKTGNDMAADGKAVGSGSKTVQASAGASADAALDIAVANPKLWSPETPVLYRAVTEVQQGGKTVDSVETTFGIRTLSWSVDKGLLLNGKSIKLAGGSVHHDNGPLGSAAFDRAEERKAELLKAAGFNAVRTAHNPPSPAFLDACDRVGLLVLDEPFDVWTKSKAKFDYARVFNEWWQRDVGSMVLRDRNHPSIIAWGIGNEIPEAWPPEGAPIAKQRTARVRALDTTRPLTEAFPGATYTPSTDAVMAQLDITGYNYNLEQNSAKDHARVPGRIMMTTESMPAVAFNEWKLVHAQPYILGEFVWTAMDYLGESGIGAWSLVTPEQAAEVDKVSAMMNGMMSNMGADGKNPFEAIAQMNDKPNPMMSLMFPGFPWHAANSGDIDLTGFRKPQSWYRDIVWNGGDRVYATVRMPEPAGKKILAIGWSVYPTLPSWTWPGQEGKEMQVEVYAGTDKVRLYLNDKLVGEMPTGVEQERKATFKLPYTPGTLKAVGVDGGREVATSVLETTGEAAQLQLKADRNVVDADGQDLSYIVVEAVDAQGRLQPNAVQEVEFAVSGPGTIAAVGNGDGTSAEAYQGSKRALFHGRALVVVRSSHKAGRITLTAKAPGLKDGLVTVTAGKKADGAMLPE